MMKVMQAMGHHPQIGQAMQGRKKKTEMVAVAHINFIYGVHIS